MNEERIKVLRRNMILSDGTAMFPKSLVFYPTLRCNLMCKMCYQRFHNRNVTEMSLKDIEDMFSQYKFDSVMLVGGEIFMRQDIIDIINFFATISSEVSIQTNASLIKDEHIKELNTCDSLKNMWISLDGLEELHDVIRGTGVFKRAVNVIKKLHKNIRVHINTVIMKENISELEKLYEHLKDLDVASVTFQYEMKYEKTQYESANKKLSDKQIEGHFYSDCVQNEVKIDYLIELKKVIKKLKLQESDRTKIDFAPTIFFDNIEEYADLNCLRTKKIICRDIVNGILKVDPLGNIMLCEAINISLYNLKEVKLSDIWNSEKVKKIRKNLCNDNMFEMCYRCCCVERY